jgi:tetratricopeptide (TPR) repeat protein
MWLNSLGGVFQRQGKFDEAVAAFEKSYELLVKLSDERGQAMVQNSFGGLWQRMKKFDKAIEAFERSYNLSVKLSDEIGQAMVCTSLGKVYLSLNDYQKAIIQLDKGFEINEKLRNRQGLGIVTPPLVRALLKTNRREDAAACYQRAIALAPKNKRILALKDEIFNKDQPLKTGTVKLVKTNDKGRIYGFIVPDDGGSDIYFNEEAVPPQDLPKLAAGAAVQFVLRRGFKGPTAHNISVRKQGK